MIPKNCSSLKKGMCLEIDATLTFLKNRERWEKELSKDNLVIELLTMRAVSDELLLHTTGMKWTDKTYRKVNGASAKLLRLPAFQDTQVNPGEFIERWY